MSSEQQPLVEPVGQRREGRGADAIEAVFRPVRVGNAFEECVGRLLSAIELGLVRSGERLPTERELAKRLDVSRMTLRQAIHSLQSAGFVESRRGRNGGTFVVWEPAVSRHRPVKRAAIPATSEAGDTLVLRDALEVGTAVAAALCSLSPAQAAQLRTCLSETEKAEALSYRRADSRLHLAIAEATGSPSLVAAVAEVRMRLNGLLDEVPIAARNLARSNEQHRELIDCILADDAPGARAAMEDHLTSTSVLLRCFLESRSRRTQTTSAFS